MNCTCKEDPQTRSYSLSSPRLHRDANWSRQTGLIRPNESSPRARAVRGEVASLYTDFEFEPVKADFPSLGPVGSLLAAWNFLHAVPEIDTTTYNDSSGVATVTSVAPALGVFIRWAVNADEFAPFELRIQTAGFRRYFQNLEGSTKKSVNRDVTLYIRKGNGGSVYLPFAYTESGILPEGRVTVGQIDTEVLATTIGAGTDAPLINQAGATAATVTCTDSSARTSFSFSVGLISSYTQHLQRVMEMARAFG